jgi:phospholipid/cholesterol/gamma-HCH transport system permease protein
MELLATVGRVFILFLVHVGRLATFAATTVFHAVHPPFYPRQIVRQMIEIGYFSLPVVGLTAIFSGMVIALLGYTGFARFSA